MSMRKSAKLLLAASLLAGLMIQPAFSAEAAKEAVITVSGEAHASLAPDLAIISFAVSKTEKTARAALDANNQAMTAVVKALKESGIAAKDLQTSGFSIAPQFVYPNDNNNNPKPPVLTGYTVTNTLTVRLRDLAKIGSVLDRSVTLGINEGGSINFSNENPEKTIDGVRAAAMKNAAAKAKILAEAAGVKLGRIVEISEASAAPEPRALAPMAMAKEASDQVPVEAGELSYSVTVNASFAIDQ